MLSKPGTPSYLITPAKRANCKVTKKILTVKGLLELEQMEDIQPHSIDHQAEEQEHPNHLRILHELVARLSAGAHFHAREGGMAAVQCWDRQDVHKRQQDAKDAREGPE